MTSATSDVRPSERHRLLADLIRRQVGVVSAASDAIYRHILTALPPAVDDAALRRHDELVAGAKTGTLSNVE
jgi:hypothetical protein